MLNKHLQSQDSFAFSKSIRDWLYLWACGDDSPSLIFCLEISSDTYWPRLQKSSKLYDSFLHQNCCHIIVMLNLSRSVALSTDWVHNWKRKPFQSILGLSYWMGVHIPVATNFCSDGNFASSIPSDLLASYWTHYFFSLGRVGDAAVMGFFAALGCLSFSAKIMQDSPSLPRWPENTLMKTVFSGSWCAIIMVPVGKSKMDEFL